MKVFKNSISVENIALLKEKVEILLGRKVLSHSDCMHLADDVLKKTDRRIGITTYRRLFEIDESKNLPSAYTLDTLSIYSGFKSWLDFIKNTDFEYEKEHAVHALESIDWQFVKAKADNISRISLKAARNKSGIRYDYTINRTAIFDHIKNFLTTPYSATTIVSPAGYGKTIALLKVIEKLFISKEAEYKNDILWFVDASMISGLITKGFDLNKWIDAQIGIDPADNYKEYFALNTDKRKGRMILIIDSIDKITERSNKLTDFFESIINLVALNDETPWFKVILSMRSDTWSKMIQYSKNLPLIESQWYNMDFYNSSKFYNNMPLLSNEEKNRIFLNVMKKSKYPKKVESVRQQILTRNFYDYFSLPILLQIYINNLTISDEAITTPITLFVEFYKIVVSSGKYSDEKQMIIENILEYTDFGLKDFQIKKKELLFSIDSRFADKAYQELLSYGIVLEVNHYNKFGTHTTYVRIGFPNLFSFLIALKSYEYFDEPNILLYKFVIKRFDNNSKKMNILKWLIYIPFYLKNYDLIFDFRMILYELDRKKKELSIRDNQQFNEMINIIGFCIRNDKEARKYLLPRFASDMLWQKYYFESFVDYDYINSYYGEAVYEYCLYKRNAKGVLYAHLILLHRNTIMIDFEKARYHLQIIDNVEHKDLLRQPYSFAMSIIFKSLYFLVFYRKIPESGLDIALNMLDILPKEIGEYRQAVFLSSLTSLTNSAERYDISINIRKNLLKRNSNYEDNKKKIPEFYIFMVLIAEALIEFGMFENGLEILNKFKVSDIDNKRQTFAIIYDIALGKYHYYRGEYLKGKEIIDNNTYISGQLKLGIYHRNNLQLLKTIEKSIEVSK